MLDEHCGWVRSVAIAQGRWLFSCACNTLRQWDMARAIPRCVNTVTLDKGDILSLVASKDKVFAATAEGSLRHVSISTNQCCRKCRGPRPIVCLLWPCMARLGALSVTVHAECQV